MNFYSLFLLLVIGIAYVSCQDEVVEVDQCPQCNDDCFLGRKMDSEGCGICNECVTSGIFESDILIDDPDSYTDLLRRYRGIPQPRGLQRNEERKWPKNGKFVTIPYTYAASVSSTKRRNIEAAMDKFVSNTCIRFARRTNEASYVNFVGTGGCSSYVGRTGRAQTISIGNGCDRREGTIIHEIMHALGFWHEQSRGDRDDHVTILWNNIRAGADRNFQKQLGDWDPLGSPYDTGSVLHYGGYYFSRNNQPTIVDKHTNLPIVAQRVGFSTEDINQINLRYDCTDYPRVTPTTPAPTTTIQTTTTTIAPENCFDIHHSCQSWRESGYCELSEYVQEQCVQSCSGCQGVATEASTTTASTTIQPTTTTATTTATTTTTTTPKPTVDSNGVCEDISSSCQYWKDQDYCGGNYESYMRQNCEKTCGYCESTEGTETVTIVCEDKHDACSFWAENDYCTHESYTTFMKNNCEKSCADQGLEGFCEDNQATTEAITTTTTTAAAETTTIECSDQTASCTYWQEREFCTSETYAAYMERNCPKSCGYC